MVGNQKGWNAGVSSGSMQIGDSPEDRLSQLLKKSRVSTPEISSRQLPATNVPDVFDLSAYDVCESWGLQEWAAALSFRMEARQRWRRTYLLWKDESIPSVETRRFQEVAFRLLRNPLSYEWRMQPFRSRPSSISDQSVADYFDARHSVDDPRYSEWFERSWRAWENPIEFPSDKDTAEQISQKESIQLDHQMVDATPAWKMHREVAEFDGRFFIAVDLGASDDHLVKEFEAWIKKTRLAANLKPIHRQFNKIHFIRWHEQRLLPYLDLVFWAETHGKRIKHNKIGSALFPDADPDASIELGSEGHVRKTIAPNALGIVSEEFVSALFVQLRASND